MLNCHFCRRAAGQPENATYVFEGEPVCARMECRQKARDLVDQQSRDKCLELGIPWRPELSRPFAGGP